ncbi:hypothetical protein TSACC_2876 [Terrimicrobium sacchariphilum]|uniref:Uncharacterized protein n=1 Tax=Terrimicrobium sacchariphilum TaxID=690879 RepID=A0A146G6A3_TERSA|nr:hypothetical protein [Terrimicrobium sacchariphilum]GAT32477.1 hypothetical protein TSACC_2876 [Terrimicrobium sacchariphilum]
MDLDDLKKLTAADWTIIVSAALGLICPGVLTIWALNPDLISELTTPKIVVLAAAISAPVVFLNFLLLATQNRIEILFDQRGVFCMSCLASTLSFVVPLGFYMAQEMNLQTFLWLLFVSVMGIGGGFWLLTKISIWKEWRKQSRLSPAAEDIPAQTDSKHDAPQAGAASH